jgi:hypothetical protein
LDRFAGFAFGFLPGFARHFVEGGGALGGGPIAGEGTDLIRRHPQQPVFVLDDEVFAGFVVDRQAFELEEAPDAVVAVNDEVPRLHLVGVHLFGGGFAPLADVAGSGEAVLAEEFFVGDDRNPERRQHKPFQFCQPEYFSATGVCCPCNFSMAG